MRNRIFTPKFFKIESLSDKLSIGNLLNGKLIFTFNQLMKTDEPIKFILIFDENEPEITLLLAYCYHFNIKLIKLCKEDVLEIKKQKQFARMICIPSESKLASLVEKKLCSLNSFELPIDLSKCSLN